MPPIPSSGGVNSISKVVNATDPVNTIELEIDNVNFFSGSLETDPNWNDTIDMQFQYDDNSWNSVISTFTTNDVWKFSNGHGQGNGSSFSIPDSQNTKIPFKIRFIITFRNANPLGTCTIKVNYI